MLYFDTVVRCLFDQVYHLQQAEFVLIEGLARICLHRKTRFQACNRKAWAKSSVRNMQRNIRDTMFQLYTLEANTRPSNESHVAQRVLKTAE